MKKAFLCVFFMVVLVSCLAFVGTLHVGTAQSATPTPAPAAAVASGGNGDLELTIALVKTDYSLGEPVNLTLTITNINNQTINFTHTGYDFDFQVTNDTNNQVYKWSNFQAFPDIVSITPLQAGMSFSANFTWLGRLPGDFFLRRLRRCLLRRRCSSASRLYREDGGVGEPADRPSWSTPGSYCASRCVSRSTSAFNRLTACCSLSMASNN